MASRVLTAVARSRWRWALVLAPFVLLSSLVARFHNTMPMYDEWAIAPIFQKHDAGQLGLSDFWGHRWSDHRIVVQRLVIFGLGAVSRWNVSYEVVVSLVAAAATFALVLHMISRYFEGPETRMVAAIAASVIVFSPLAWENWLWGFQLGLLVDVFGLVLAVAALTGMPRRSRPTRFALAVGGALLATLCLSEGLLVWIVCFPVFVVLREWRRWSAPWIVLAVFTALAYSRDYHDVGGVSRIGFVDAPTEFFGYWQTYIARPVTVHGSLVTSAFVLLLVTAVGTMIYVRPRRPGALTASVPWLVLMLYALATAALTAVGRAHFGVGQASSSRYTTVSALFLLGLVMILLKAQSDSIALRPRVTSAAAVVVLMLLVGVNYPAGVRQMERHYSEHVTVARACARTATGPDDPCLGSMHPSPRDVWPLLQYLRQKHLAGL